MKNNDEMAIGLGVLTLGAIAYWYFKIRPKKQPNEPKMGGDVRNPMA